MELPDGAWRRVADAFDEAGRKAWPHVKLEKQRFLERLATLAPTAVDLEQRAGADLYLVTAFIGGDRAAAAALDALLQAEADRSLRRFPDSDRWAAEAVDRLRDRLLGGPDGASGRLADYQGRGPLSTYLRSAVVREALNRRRAHGGTAGEVDVEKRSDPGSPEREIAQTMYRAEFVAAFEEALCLLSRRDRALLRLALKGFDLERMASCYGVHRTTAGRWMADARARLLAATRRRLAERLQLPPSQVTSHLRLFQSQWDLSLERLLDESRKRP
ncbi:MAG: transcriptional regulator [Deltaproteobacteria bacterium]|nr:transcriptional regulator [Deltaproteobacteria bacterium]